MKLTAACVLANVARATYDDNLYNFQYWHPKGLDELKGGRTFGFVASDNRMTVLAFRGTQNRLRPLESFLVSTRQWITNINYAQKNKGSFRIHRGFDEQLADVYDQVIRLARKHGVQKKPFYITGHSAGGALATLAAWRLSCDGLAPNGVYVFASPRVGDRAFSEMFETKSIPLYRFEQHDDIVTHLPLSPFLAKVIGKFIVDDILRKLDEVFPGCGLSGFNSSEVEYIHAGRLFYKDEAGQLLCSESIVRKPSSDSMELAWNKIEEIGRFNAASRSAVKIVPKEVLDVVRVIRTFTNVIDQIDAWLDKTVGSPTLFSKLKFIVDHDLADLQEFLLGLVRAR